MDENLDNSEQCFFIFSHDRKSFLTTSSKHTFNAGDTHAIYNVPRQPKWNPFRCFKHKTLFKRDTKINMYNLGRVLINENIHGMAIPKSHDISYH
uniref:ATM n=1 Tax=Arundo donax TaxID=35708 RepID=A0A0A9H6B3_ARUDO